MREGAKKRLAGLTVVVVLAVIFVPMWFEDEVTEPLIPMPEPMPEPLSQAPSFDDRVRAESFTTPSDPVPLEPEPNLSATTELSEPEPPGEPEPPAAMLPDGEEESEPLTPPGVLGATAAAPRQTPPPVAAPAARQTSPDLAPPSPPPGGSWVTQVASFGATDPAERLANKLRADGFPAFVEAAEVRGRTFYRVRVGPAANRAEAEGTAARLRQSFSDALIQRYP